MKSLLHLGSCFGITLLLAIVCGDKLALAQRDLKNIPDPDPELERQTFILGDGLEVNLFAGDPLLAKPIQMNFDAQGSLWVASSEVYPQIKPGAPATDKILILDDTNHDGVADKTTVFADGLLIPTGVIPGDGGAYVANSTELIHLSDTNNDGQADKRRVVLSGFGTEDTHHLLHTLRWGPDGCLYMNQSIYIHSHVETPYGVKRLNGGGIWRFRPDSLKLEVLCHGFVNPWGHHFDRFGQSFATDGAYGEGINYVFPGSVFCTAPGATRILAGLNPGSPKHCGLEIISGRHFPAEWQGNMITCDFRAHRVCRFVVTEDNAGYASRQEVEIIKSNHVAFRPIDVKMGPDGALYIADWYNPIIQHGEVDFRDERRDHVHGRIWRVTYKGGPVLNSRIAADASIPQLLQRLRDPEEWVRINAKTMLQDRGRDAVLPALKQWLAALDPKTEDFDALRLEALWLNEGLEVVDVPLLESLLSSKDHRIRAAAVRTVAHWIEQLPERVKYLTAAVNDDHPRVRLEAVRALSLIPTSDAAALACLALDRPVDRFVDFALWKTMRDLAPFWLPGVRAGTFDFRGRIDHLTFALKASDAPGVVQPLLQLVDQQKISADRLPGVLALAASLGDAKELGFVVDQLMLVSSPLTDDQKALVLQALAEASQLRKLQAAGDPLRIKPFLESGNVPLQSAAARAVGVWKSEALRPQLLALLRNDASPAAVLQGAVEGMVALGGEESVKELTQFATHSTNNDTRSLALEGLARLNVKAAATLTAQMLTAPPEGMNVADIVTLLVSQKNGPQELTSALENRQLSADTARLVLRGVQTSSQPAPELIAAVRTAGKLENAGWKWSPELTEQLVNEVAASGNAARGELVYRRKENQCLKCHAIGGAGGLVGPDLVSIGATAQIDYLVEALLAPAAKVKENYHSQLVATDDGRILTGIPVRDTKTELVLRNAEDQLITIAKDSIEIRKDGRSLMPDGLTDTLTRSELVDLLKFLSELGKIGDYSLSKAKIARRWEVLTWTKEANQRLNRSSYDTAASDDAAFIWDSAYSQVNGDLPLSGLPEFVVHARNPPTTFIRCDLEVTTPGQVQLKVNDLTGANLWLDGKPKPLADTNVLELEAGRHRLTFAIDRMARKSPLHVELQEVANSPAQVQFVQGK